MNSVSGLRSSCWHAMPPIQLTQSSVCVRREKICFPNRLQIRNDAGEKHDITNTKKPDVDKNARKQGGEEIFWYY